MLFTIGTEWPAHRHDVLVTTALDREYSKELCNGKHTGERQSWSDQRGHQLAQVLIGHTAKGGTRFSREFPLMARRCEIKTIVHHNDTECEVDNTCLDCKNKERLQSIHENIRR